MHLRAYAAAIAALLWVAFLSVPGVADEKPASEQPTPDYLIIAANDLQGAAEEWQKHREANGRTTRVATLAQIATWAGKEKINLLDLKNFIRKHGGEKPAPEFQVLLLGDCPAEGSEGFDPRSEIPWFMSTYKDAYERSAIPGDNFLADTIGEDNEMPDFAIGRIPARTPAQAAIALKKVKAYESARLGEWLKRLTFFAGEGRFGAAVDQMLENLFTQMAEQVIDPAYDLRMTYANIKSAYAYVPSRFSDKVLEEANTGAFLLSYMGHGAVDRLDDMHVSQGEGKRDLRYPILQDDDVAKFNIEEGKLPVMIIVACATGFLDHKELCLTERICFAEKAPVAVISSSRDSHPYSNTLLQNALITEMTKNRRGTLGEAFKLAKREIVEGKDKNRKSLENMAAFIIPKREEREKLNRAHLYLYNLIGDPGLRLRYPNIELSAWNSTNGVATAKDKPLTSLVAIQGETLKLVVKPNERLPYTPKDKTSTAYIECGLDVRRSQIFGEIKALNTKDLISPDDAQRKAAEEAVVQNHATANDKRVVDYVGEKNYIGEALAWSEFTIKIEEGLAPGDYIVKLFALDSTGQHCGFAALKLKVKEK
ncbi:MAG: hypothetical protein IT461_07565 [Planctomycetes bacterium]|nr:hypothetical protein [Planctomycetota bacterium]